MIESLRPVDPRADAHFKRVQDATRHDSTSQDSSALAVGGLVGVGTILLTRGQELSLRTPAGNFYERVKDNATVLEICAAALVFDIGYTALAYYIRKPNLVQILGIKNDNKEVK